MHPTNGNSLTIERPVSNRHVWLGAMTGLQGVFYGLIWWTPSPTILKPVTSINECPPCPPKRPIAALPRNDAMGEERTRAIAAIRYSITSLASVKLDHANEHAPIYSPDERFQQEVEKPQGCGWLALLALQFRAPSQDPAHHPCYGAGISDRLWSLEELVEQTS